MTKVLKPRPHTWHHPDPRVHDQYYGFLRMRAQANFRHEEWDLTFEEYQAIWDARWESRGKRSDQYCLTREDPEKPWNLANIICILRHDQLVRANQIKKDKGRGRYSKKRGVVGYPY